MSAWSRRRLVASGLSVSALALLRPAAAARLLATPPQPEGPFYPLTLPLDTDNDLIQLAGRAARASGTVLHLGGRVLDPAGRPVRGARLEIWQCDAFGVYHHPGDRHGRPDPNFQGFGRTVADDAGAYRFRTLVPVPYPGRTPHIHFRIAGPGIAPLTTQMYLAGHPLNASDFLYQQIGDPRAQAAVSVALLAAPELEPEAKSAAKRAIFDIVLGQIPRDG